MPKFFNPKVSYLLREEARKGVRLPHRKELVIRLIAPAGVEVESWLD